MANYEVTTTWTHISDIMGDDYDATKELRVHNNVEEPNRLLGTEETNPSADLLGRKYPSLCEIYVEAGTDFYLKVDKLDKCTSGFDVEISFVE